jgi:hypothetical protein
MWQARNSMNQDETCFFPAADFDKTTWQDDVAASWETCRQNTMPAALERTRIRRQR